MVIESLDVALLTSHYVPIVWPEVASVDPRTLEGEGWASGELISIVAGIFGSVMVPGAKLVRRQRPVIGRLVRLAAVVSKHAPGVHPVWAGGTVRWEAGC